MKTYKYDIAISLCQQDIEYARKLFQNLNPSLQVFFYEEKQHELITKSGPEVFAKVFKEEARVVVILSRSEWSESYYTEIERNAIIARTSVKNEGYHFLFVIPMEPNQIPNWYPPTNIYADPRHFSIEDMARFVEFKVVEWGGELKEITFEDRHNNFLNKIEEKRAIVKLQNSSEAIVQAQNEVNVLKDCFNQKNDILRKNIFDNFHELLFSEHQNVAYCRIGEYELQCKIILPDPMYNRIVTTQDFCISFELLKIFGNFENSKSLENEQRLFYFNPPLNAWSLPHLYEHRRQKEELVLFRNRDNSKYYDLINSQCTQILVDAWFQKLLTLATASIERYL